MSYINALLCELDARSGYGIPGQWRQFQGRRRVYDDFDQFDEFEDFDMEEDWDSDYDNWMPYGRRAEMCMPRSRYFGGAGAMKRGFGSYDALASKYLRGYNPAMLESCGFRGMNVPCGPMDRAALFANPRYFGNRAAMYCGVDHESANDSRRLRNVERETILCELMEDRDRDVCQTHHLKCILRNRRINRRTRDILEALIRGQRIPRDVLIELLCQDVAIDRVADKVCHAFVADQINNRNADHIIHDLAFGINHVPHPNKWQAEKWNRRCDNLLAKLGTELASPHVGKKLVRCGVVDDIIQCADTFAM